MKTFILKWNPAISSFKMESFIEMFHDYKDDTDWWSLNWSVWEHDKAEVGDRYFMVRVGDGNVGIVMAGYFTSAPYESDDWSGKGRRTFYCDLDMHEILDAENAPLITPSQLAEAMPLFQWDGGHSGIVLPPAYADTLEKMWDDYIAKVPADMVYTSRATFEDCVRIAAQAHAGQKDLDGHPVIFHPMAVAAMGSTEYEMMTAVLHDVVEDSDQYTFEDLLSDENVPYPVVQALRMLTHDEQEPYMDYVARIIDSGNPLAIITKLHDLQHNLARGRAGGHTRQVEKHSRALALFQERLPELFR